MHTDLDEPFRGCAWPSDWPPGWKKAVLSGRKAVKPSMRMGCPESSDATCSRFARSLHSTYTLKT